MPAILGQAKTVDDEYGHEIGITRIKCNELRVMPDTMCMTIQYWKSEDGVTWGDMKRLKLKDDPSTGGTEMTTAIADITAHLISKGITVADDGVYVINRDSSYFIVADRVFNTTYTIV